MTRRSCGFFVLLAVIAATAYIAETSFSQPPGDRRPGPPPGGRLELSDTDQNDAMIEQPKGTVVLRGGHDTDHIDRGRPVVLIAAALGVEPVVFRDAFSGVKPSRGGPPSRQLAQANKKVLMDALGKYGITNERLDTVSNYYRYQPQSGELWKHTAAQAKAVIENGNVVRVDLIVAGSGYSTAPVVTIAGYPEVKIEATIEYSTDLKLNGRIGTISIVSK